MADQFYTVASDSETAGEEKQQSSFPELAIGIDIGTAQSSVAVWNGAQVELLRNNKNKKLMQSYVMFKDEVPSSGINEELSYDELEVFCGSAVFNMKRLVGRTDTDPVVHRDSKTLPFLVQTSSIGARPLIAPLVNNVWRSTTAEEVLAIFLVELKAMAAVHLKRPIINAVLTIPVSFNRFQQTRVERACAMAGLHILRLMPEPTAIALVYNQQQQQTIPERMGSGMEKDALIFNMGAGYCDVAITATAGGVSQIKAMSGSAVGGEDILQNVLRHLVSNFELLCLDRSSEKIKSMGLLRVATQDAIHKLSYQTSVRMDVDFGDGAKISGVLDRSEFEKVNRDVFDECEKLVVQCLVEAKLSPEDLADVVLVGGCSKIPKVRSIVLGLCRKGNAYEGIDPFEAAVYGAALEGAIASGVGDPSGCLDLLTIQATPSSLGIRADGGSYVTIIQRDTSIPAMKDMLFTTTHDDQAGALIVVYEGEGKKAEENHMLGYFMITGIPPLPKGMVEINVTMDIDASNALRVFAGVVQKGTRLPASSFVQVRMPTLDDGQGWCDQALVKMYGSSLDLSSILKVQQ